MNTPLQAAADDALAYERARREVRRLRGWYVHAAIYLCVIGALWLLYLAGPAAGLGHRAWPLPATLGWGLGLTIHGIITWSKISQAGRQWEARKIRERMARG